jgi:hypothetical protein
MSIREFATLFVGKREVHFASDLPAAEARARAAADAAGLEVITGMFDDEEERYLGVGEVLAEVGEATALDASLDPMDVLEAFLVLEAQQSLDAPARLILQGGWTE